ncbi:MAG TPA: GerW family sporulation protein [Candidatus Gemmiger stercoripullorum]|nr:GerW family sporulation protein [Candidatus Gemmiger stercoripullorum]
MAEHPLQGMMGITMDKVREMVDSSTIIGDPIKVDADTTIIPVSRVTFGFASGGSDVGAKASKDMFGGGSGAGVSITPVAFLIVTPSGVRTMQLTEHACTIDNAISALPELVDKLAAMLGRSKPSQETATEAAKEAFAAAEKAETE